MCSGVKSMDQIRIDDLSFTAHHGVYDFERKNGQLFVVSAVLETDTSTAGWTDCLEDSTSYADVAAFIVEILTNNTISLLEAAAEQVCRAVLLRFPLIQAVELELKKPNAPIPLDFASVSVRIKRAWHTAIVALGSNMGSRENALNGALTALQQRPEIRVGKISSLINTAPYGGVEQDDFLNGVCAIETVLSPQQLLDALHEIEEQYHRTREIHWGPRTLDLDIIFYDDLVLNTSTLIVPHPDMHNRDFVLRPLYEIAPQMIHPVFGKSVHRMYEELKQCSI